MNDENTNVVSLVDRLNTKNSNSDIFQYPQYYMKKFPIFEGDVILVPFNRTTNNGIFSDVYYLSSDIKYPDFQELEKTHNEEQILKIKENIFKKNMHRGVVPFGLNPLLVNNSKVKGYISNGKLYKFKIFPEQSNYSKNFLNLSKNDIQRNKNEFSYEYWLN